MKKNHHDAKIAGFLLPESLLDQITRQQQKESKRQGRFVSKSNLVADLLSEALAQRRPKA